MADPALQTAALAGLEFVINKALELDPATSHRLSKLDGKVLLIHCLSPDVKVYCVPGDGSVALKSWEQDGRVNSSLTGAFSDYVQLLQAEDKAAALINGNLSVHGDSGDFIELQTALAELNVDWEQPLANVFGDIGGHQLGRFIRNSFAVGKQVNQSLQQQLEQLVHAEASLLPPRSELESFYSDVGGLSQRIDRLHARIQRVSQRLQKNGALVSRTTQPNGGGEA